MTHRSSKFLQSFIYELNSGFFSSKDSLRILSQEIQTGVCLGISIENTSEILRGRADFSEFFAIQQIDVLKISDGILEKCLETFLQES